MSAPLPYTRTSRLVAVVFMSLITSGCVTTGLWKQSNRSTAGDGGLAGILNGPGGQPSAVLVRYHPIRSDYGFLAPAQHLYAVIPFAPDGRAPITPYGYAGPERHPGRIVAALGTARPTSGRITLVFGNDADAMLKSPAFRAAGHSDARVATDYWFRVSYVDDLAVYAFGPRAPKPTDPEWSAATFPADAQFVIVPAVVPRPPETLAGSRMRAAALTPVALAVDAVFPAVAVVALILDALDE